MTDYSLPPADTLPAAMVTQPQWLCWRAEARDGKMTKVPVDPNSGSYASATDAATWAEFATARDYADREDIGLGFVFTDDDPLAGVDLDDCRDVDTGELTEWADAIVSRLDSFTEISPSGTGVHVIVKGDLPDGRNRHGNVEIYETARFFTVTGDHVSETPTTVERRQDALAAIHDEHVAPDRSEPVVESSDMDVTVPAAGRVADHDGNDLDDEELLTKAKNAANGAKFARLYRGSTAGYPSQSEADMALCSLLAFWTGGDATQMDRLFRDSGLMRPKWDEQHFTDGATYGERTIERAIAGTDESYDGADSQWHLFEENSPADSTNVPGSNDGTEEMSEDETVPTDVVVTLRERLAELEAENEELRSDLAIERERRRQLEAEQDEDTNRGLFSGLFP